MSNHDNQAGVGDDAQGRHGQEQRTDADVDGMANSRPTSPATGAAKAAAARAAYAGFDTGRAPGEDLGPVEADEPAAGGPALEEEAGGDVPGTPAPAAGPAPEPAATPQPASSADEVSASASADAQLAAERLADYQRLNAEYVNYKRRVDRDRAEDRKRATASVVESLLPVLDEIHFARQHGELAEDSPFAKIAAKLEGILAGHGVTMFGEVGETFDPMVHEALMHTTADLPPGTTDTTVVMVMQPGFRMGERVVRPARVSVADPA